MVTSSRTRAIPPLPIKQQVAAAVVNTSLSHETMAHETIRTRAETSTFGFIDHLRPRIPILQPRGQTAYHDDPRPPTLIRQHNTRSTPTTALRSVHICKMPWTLLQHGGHFNTTHHSKSESQQVQYSVHLKSETLYLWLVKHITPRKWSSNRQANRYSAVYCIGDKWSINIPTQCFTYIKSSAYRPWVNMPVKCYSYFKVFHVKLFKILYHICVFN